MKPVYLLLSLFLIISCAPLESGSESLQIPEEMERVNLVHGSLFTLSAEQIYFPLKGKMQQMYGYNGNIPGPLFIVEQGSETVIDFVNNLDVPTSIHWHGIRADNAFDGVVGVTQEEVLAGEGFRYTLKFPDWGIYWYHPHMREDLQQEKGLYGAILVKPKNDQDIQEEVIFLDDIRLRNGVIEPFYNQANYAMMGRFGNTMFINGREQYSLTLAPSARLYLINSANTRTFNFGIEGEQVTVIGKDSELSQYPETVERVLLSPGERAIVEVSFAPGTYQMIHETPDTIYPLGTLTVKEGPLPQQQTPSPPDFSFVHSLLDTPADFEFDLLVKGHMPSGMMNHMTGGGAEAIEWEDTMPRMNAQATPESITWVIQDRATGKENRDISLPVKQGTYKKIRLHNLMDSLHPMQHPIHLHGQRFVILSTDGKANDNLAWKDVALVPAGATVDILVDFSNPGTWMMHCHIAEHLEAGMMSTFVVAA